MNASTDSLDITMTQEAVSDTQQHDRKDSLEELSVVWHRGGQRFISHVIDLGLGGASCVVSPGEHLEVTRNLSIAVLYCRTSQPPQSWVGLM
jgi:hypothetical protein